MVFGFLLFAAALAFAGYWVADYYVLDPPITTTTVRVTTIDTDETKDDCGYTGIMPKHVIDFVKNTHEYPAITKYKTIEVDLNAIPELELVLQILKNPADNNYELFTRKNRDEGQILKMNNKTSIRKSNFNAYLSTVILVHGWRYDKNQNDSMIGILKTVILQKSNVNIIVLDWETLSEAQYVTAYIAVPSVGRGLGQFLRFLRIVTGALYSRMHLIGFGFGAHLVGNAGRELKGKIGRITALDPAGPRWNTYKYGIKPIDAVYVEGIHTNAHYTLEGVHGIGARVGHADFYPNAGGKQHDCNVTYDGSSRDLDLENLCYHERSWQLFASSILQNNLVGRKCKDSRQVQIFYCRGKKMHMGNLNIKKKGSHGMYLVDTSVMIYELPDRIIFEP